MVTGSSFPLSLVTRCWWYKVVDKSHLDCTVASTLSPKRSNQLAKIILVLFKSLDLTTTPSLHLLGRWHKKPVESFQQRRSRSTSPPPPSNAVLLAATTAITLAPNATPDASLSHTFASASELHDLWGVALQKLPNSQCAAFLPTVTAGAAATGQA